MLDILIADRTRCVNFSNPFNARMWLSQLVADSRHGLLFHPDLDLPRKALGFTFSTNRFGLRGPAAAEGGGVVLGTSFAMGLSVNNGENWWDLILDRDGWFNGGMPVSPRDHEAVLDDFYRGSYDTLLYLYHPNLWKTATGFEAARASGRTIFEQMRWSAELRDAAVGYPKWIARELAKIWMGLSLYRRWGGRTFHFNASYNFLDPERNAAFLDDQTAVLARLFARFRRVVVVRVPIKEELGHLSGPSPRLDQLRANYEALWNRFRGKLDPAIQVHTVPAADFDPDDFLPYDTHWSAAGNRRFAAALRTILREHQIAGVTDHG